MRFGLQAVGSEGDVRPLLALAAGLRGAGHEVTVSICGDSSTDYRSISRALDLQFVDSSPTIDFARIADGLSRKSGADWSREFHRLLFVDNRTEDRMFEIAESLCTQNDVLISHYLCYPAKAAVLKTGTPHISVQLTYEHTPTRYRPCRIAMPNLGQRLNQYSWQELYQGTQLGLQHPYRCFWESKGLAPFEHLWSLYFSDDLNLLAVSELFCPQYPDWDRQHVVTGFLNLPSNGASLELSDRVIDFLDDGDPPVFMTFGSAADIYPNSNVEKNLRLFIDAATQAGCRAVVQTSGTDAGRLLSEKKFPASHRILFVDWVPYETLFAKCAAVVHHSGIGTCQLSLTQTCPSVLIPFTDHHATFAHRMKELQVCPPPVTREVVTPTKLAAQIGEVLTNSIYRQQASVAGGKLRAEDGVANAVAAILSKFDNQAK